MTQLTLGTVLKEAGMSKVEHHCQRWVDKAREIAVRLAKDGKPVSADDLRIQGIRPPPHPNAWGTVFRGKQWKYFGTTHSLWPPNHSRRISLWELAK